MRPAWIWGVAVALYAVFALWYDGLAGPLDADEIETHLARIADSRDGFDAERLAALRSFLEADDGNEFFMLNLIRLHPEPVALPGSGERVSAAQVLERYTGHFMPALLRRAGHPAWVGRAVGPYIEAWGVEPDPGWSIAGVIRYRSRRDLLELASDPAFGPAHAYKIAAMPNTLAFPVAPALVTFGVRPFVGVALALGAALAHLVLVSRRAKRERAQ